MVTFVKPVNVPIVESADTELLVAEDLTSAITTGDKSPLYSSLQKGILESLSVDGHPALDLAEVIENIQNYPSLIEKYKSANRLVTTLYSCIICCNYSI